MEILPDTSALTDKEVVQSIIDGKREDFEILVNRYYKQITAYLGRLLNFNEGDVQDVLQETFINTFVNLVTYNPSLSFSSWLYRIAHNLAIDLIRKKSKYYIIDTNDQAVQNQIHHNETIIQKSDLEHENIVNNERLTSILQRLDFDSRTILTLFYLQGLSLSEIADIFKTSSNTIAARLKRSKEKAKKIIDKLKL
jgi:RNA polymerase sigma-70 factor, ECF subfamily